MPLKSGAHCLPFNVFLKERRCEMVGLPKEIEIERMMNLVRGFGWVKVKEELIGDEVRITLGKKLIESEVPLSPGPPT